MSNKGKMIQHFNSRGEAMKYIEKQKNSCRVCKGKSKEKEKNKDKLYYKDKTVQNYYSPVQYEIIDNKNMDKSKESYFYNSNFKENYEDDMEVKEDYSENLYYKEYDNEDVKEPPNNDSDEHNEKVYQEPKDKKEEEQYNIEVEPYVNYDDEGYIKEENEENEKDKEDDFESSLENNEDDEDGYIDDEYKEEDIGYGDVEFHNEVDKRAEESNVPYGLGSIYNITNKKRGNISSGETIPLSSNGILIGIYHDEGSPEIIVDCSGVYEVSYSISCSAGIGAAVGILINNNLDLSTIVDVITEPGQINGQSILQLNKGDTICLSNISDELLVLQTSPYISVKLIIKKL